jgi:hypothetical protein
MTPEVAARLKWHVRRPAGIGYPRGERFATPARFEHQGDDWSNDAWSVVVSSAEPVAADSTQSVRVRFLMEDAPHDWLISGRRFELYEGRLLLAEGVIE